MTSTIGRSNPIGVYLPTRSKSSPSTIQSIEIDRTSRRRLPGDRDTPTPVPRPVGYSNLMTPNATINIVVIATTKTG
uniref:Uncharacterized protein n=1 Tax=Oryza sativa subsp. japonica TaxID=39947 RepID=Q6EQY6_ORYSJ|nr:hypothetical protein [Oryza sativa Japonica Group]